MFSAEEFMTHRTVDYCWYIMFSFLYADVTRCGSIFHTSRR